MKNKPRKATSRRQSSAGRRGAVSSESARPPSKPFPIVGIGASAGGLAALKEFFGALPPNTGMAFVLVQHMDPKHESVLHKLLAKETEMPVAEVKNGMEVEPNKLYVIPPNTEMTLRSGSLRLLARPPGAAGHTPIDAFLTTLAQEQKNASIGVILSGIGSDGTIGCKAIKAADGFTFAQSEESAKFSGMSSSAVAAGCVDLVLPPALIAEELARAGRHPLFTIAGTGSPSALVGDAISSYGRILRLLRSTSGVDLSYYKTNTIQRRIARRMVLKRSDNLAQYAKLLEKDPNEAEALFEDILIHVTSLFREPEMFEALTRTVFPQLVQRAKATGDAIRIWVPGCATGEEAYSLAIALVEFAQKSGTAVRIQIFATDISAQSIETARVGIYDRSSLADLSPSRTRRFFAKVDGGYQISKAIREICVFARHDLAKDPPFSRLDLISCRNVLIYFGTVLQKRVITIFHYALRQDGTLLLGKSETIDSHSGLFAMQDRKHKIYTRKDSPMRPLPDMLALGFQPTARGHRRHGQANLGFDPRREAERIVMERYAPAAIFVDNNLQIVSFQGDVSPFLRPSSGEPSFELVRMLRPELVLEVRKAIFESGKSRSVVRRERIRCEYAGVTKDIDIEVVPVKGRQEKVCDFLVLFLERRLKDSDSQRPKTRQTETAEQKSQVGQLKRELESTRDYMRSIIQDAEASTEELRAANEEVLSSNEELQSTNEELETAKEELQSANEELTTLNEELHNRNTELTQLANDLSSLLVGVEIPVIMLGPDRRIRRYTPGAEKVFNLIASDVGRPISNIRGNIAMPDLDVLMTQAIKANAVVEREVQDQDGRWFSLRVRPYNAPEGESGSLLLALVDIDSVKRESVAVVETINDFLIVLDSDFRVISANPAFYRTFRLNRKDVENQSLFQLAGARWNIPGLRDTLQHLLVSQSDAKEFELEYNFPEGGHRSLLFKARLLPRQEPALQVILLVIEDLTSRKRFEKEILGRELALRDSQTKLRALTGDLISSSETMSRKMAREVHDAFTHGVLALSLRAAEMERKAPAALKKDIRALTTDARKLAGDMQELSRSFHPAVLDELGLVPSLRAECATFMKRNEIPVHFVTSSDLPERFPENVALCFYRIVQEGLRNIGRHSRARKVQLTLAMNDSEVSLILADDGRGFDIHKAHKKGGLGLISMEERARLADGTFIVSSEPGRGTTIRIMVPLKEGRRK